MPASAVSSRWPPRHRSKAQRTSARAAERAAVAIHRCRTRERLAPVLLRPRSWALCRHRPPFTCPPGWAAGRPPCRSRSSRTSSTSSPDGTGLSAASPVSSILRGGASCGCRQRSQRVSRRRCPTSRACWRHCRPPSVSLGPLAPASCGGRRTFLTATRCPPSASGYRLPSPTTATRGCRPGCGPSAVTCWLALDEQGRYLGGVGLKRHHDSGREIAVVTDERARGRGLARRLVAQAARMVLAEGRTVVYLHAPDNEAWARVAPGKRLSGHRLAGDRLVEPATLSALRWELLRPGIGGLEHAGASCVWGGKPSTRYCEHKRCVRREDSRAPCPGT